MGQFLTERDIKRRCRSANEIEKWLVELDCNYFATITFNAGADYSITTDGAENRLGQFYNRQMRELLGARWHKQLKEQQAFCMANLEYGAGSKYTNSADGLHWHLHYKIDDKLKDKFENIEHRAIWQGMNRLHRGFDMSCLNTVADLKRTARYVVKQIKYGKEENNFVCCGYIQSEN